MEETMEVKEGEKGLGGNIYEIAFLYVPTITEEEIAGRFGDAKALLEKEGAVFISEDMPRATPLAYEMSRTIANKKTWFDHAYFGWVKFELDPAKVAEVKNVLARNEEIIRFMIVRTVRENTIASKKPMGLRRRIEQRKDEPARELTSEEKQKIDAEIDALVEPEAIVTATVES